MNQYGQSTQFSVCPLSPGSCDHNGSSVCCLVSCWIITQPHAPCSHSFLTSLSSCRLSFALDKCDSFILLFHQPIIRITWGNWVASLSCFSCLRRAPNWRLCSFSRSDNGQQQGRCFALSLFSMWMVTFLKQSKSQFKNEKATEISCVSDV